MWALVVQCLWWRIEWKSSSGGNVHYHNRLSVRLPSTDCSLFASRDGCAYLLPASVCCYVQRVLRSTTVRNAANSQVVGHGLFCFCLLSVASGPILLGLFWSLKRAFFGLYKVASRLLRRANDTDSLRCYCLTKANSIGFDLLVYCG